MPVQPQEFKWAPRPKKGPRTEEELVKLRQMFDSFASWHEVIREMGMGTREIKYYKQLWGYRT